VRLPVLGAQREPPSYAFHVDPRLALESVLGAEQNAVSGLRAALAILLKNLPTWDRAARKPLTAFCSAPRTDSSARRGFDMEGVKTVLALRSK